MAKVSPGPPVHFDYNKENLVGENDTSSTSNNWFYNIQFVDNVSSPTAGLLLITVSIVRVGYMRCTVQHPLSWLSDVISLTISKKEHVLHEIDGWDMNALPVFPPTASARVKRLSAPRKRPRRLWRHSLVLWLLHTSLKFYQISFFIAVISNGIIVG